MNHENVDVRKLAIEEERRAKQAVRDFVEGARVGDSDLLTSTFSALDYGALDGGGWRRAFQAASRLDSVPNCTREYFLQVFLRYGDHIRQETNDDLAFVDGLRMLVPAYDGPPLRLYRGEQAENRRRRTYGLSWTSTASIAQAFAETGYARLSKGGSVLLSTRASCEAVVCAPALIADDYGEQEYILDRRRLGKVVAEKRYPQLSFDEFDALGRRIRDEMGNDAG